MNKGKFVFSLDFELYWGTHHNKKYEVYEPNLEAAVQNLPIISKLFIKHNAFFTCASVGMLYNSDFEEWHLNTIKSPPNYKNISFSPYDKISYIENKINARHLFAPKILREIAKDGHEMATHTYSHFFSLESGADKVAFEEDLKMSIQIAKKFGHKFESIVFPRNQFSQEYLDICKKYGIMIYRGNPNSGLFAKSSTKIIFIVKRILRLLDSVISISGSNSFTPQKDALGMQNISASCFYRSASSFKLNWLINLHLRRIKKSMTYSAKKGRVFHLWCHPHNLSSKKDVENLNNILLHFNFLKEKYNFTCYRMMDFK